MSIINEDDPIILVAMIWIAVGLICLIAIMAGV